MEQKLIQKLSQSEKIRLTSGDGAWHTWHANGKLPPIMMCDGPHGLRKQKQDAPGQNNDSIEATCFPTESAIACSWNPQAVKCMAAAIAKEALAEQVSIVLGCGVNMKRSPLCGRNFEYFSEDPFLTGTLASAYIMAMQQEGVGTSLKHFAGNNQETHRQTANSQIDERALREIYLSAFEMVIKKAKPLTVMASYNRLNGIYACENKRLLTDILRDEWGYKGTVLSDWGACVDTAACIHAGMDLEMPDSAGLHEKNILNGIQNGILTETDLDRAVLNISKLLPKNSKQNEKGNVDFKAHHNLAVQLEKESAVLLKNEGFLPIDKSKHLFIVGDLAINMRFQGGGSSHIHATENTNVIAELQKSGCEYTYCKGYRYDTDVPDEKLEQEVLQTINTFQREDCSILFFCGLTEQYEGEGYDRKTFVMPVNQLSLLEKMRKINSRIGIVTFSGAPFEMKFADWAPAILQMYLGGQGVGEACTSILLGETNPSGKLAESWPVCVEDTPCYGNFGNNSDDVEYRESIFIGYRYYDTYKVKTRFPFGHGLSYTTFAYKEMKLEQNSYSGGSLFVSCHIKNTGNMAGNEIVQFYIVNPQCNYLRAEKELCGFEKIFLLPGEEKEVKVQIDERSFCVYDIKEKKYILPSGEYEIVAAASSEDIRLREKLQVHGLIYERDDRERLPEYFRKGQRINISEEQFAVLYERPLSHFDKRKRGEFDIHDSLEHLAKYTLLGKIFLKVAEHIAMGMYPNKERENPEVKMTLQGLHEGTLDSVMCQSEGAVPYKVAEAIVLSANGHPLLSLRKLLEKKGGKVHE